MHWKKVAIIGVGLIGGSVGLALRRRGLADEVVGVGRTLSRLQAALQSGAVSQITTELAEGVRDAQLIVVCTPVNEVVRHALAAADACPQQALITDAASTKTSIVRAVQRGLPPQRKRCFVGSHPIAGGEKSGVAAARDDLFVDRLVVVTPTPRSHQPTLKRIEAFWRSLGARTVRTTPQVHDRILAATSHLPHIVAAALAAATSEGDVQYTGGGWADTTRIAAGSPELWGQILKDNQGHILRSLDKYANMLARFRDALANGDGRQMERLLTAGKKRRDSLGN